MSFRAFLNRVLVVVGFGLLLAALWFFRNTLLLGFFAVIIAIGISIPAGWFWRRGWPRWLANSIAVVLVGVVVLGLLLWLVPTITVEIGNILVGLPQGLEALSAAYERLRLGSDFLSQILPPVTPLGSAPSAEEIRPVLDQLVNTGLPILVSGGSAAASLITNLMLVLVLAILFLADPTAYVKASFYLAPKSYHPRLLELWEELYHTLRIWLSSLFISITITVSLVLVVLGLLGMPNVLVVAVFAGVATFVPNIGAFLPLIPIAIFTLATDPAKLLIMAPTYLAIQLLESNVFSPLIVKRQLSIPAAGMFLFQILAGLVYGVLGILLAVPLLAVIITLVRELYSYDVLGFKGEKLEVTQTRSKGVTLQEGKTPAKPSLIKRFRK